MKKTNANKVSIITVAIFLAFIFLLSIINIFTPNKDFSENENRFLSKFPDSSLKNIFFGDFDTEFENYFSDQFTLRDKWIELKSSSLRFSGAIANNNVYFGKEDKLINQFIDYDEKIAANNIEYINEFVSNTDAKVNLMLVPGTAFGEEASLPFGSATINEKEVIKDLYSKTSNINCVEINDELKDGDNYFHTDHHWNHLGAYKGYEALCKSVLHKEPNNFTYEEVSNSFYGTLYSRSGAFKTKPDSIFKMISDNNIEYEIDLDGEVSNSLFFENRLEEKDKYTYYLDGNHTEVHIITNVDNNKKAIIIKDSYAHILIPYLASEYSEIVVFDLRYFHNAISPYVTDNTDIYIIYSLETFVSDASLVGLW